MDRRPVPTLGHQQLAEGHSQAKSRRGRGQLALATLLVVRCPCSGPRGPQAVRHEAGHACVVGEEGRGWGATCACLAWVDSGAEEAIEDLLAACRSHAVALLASPAVARPAQPDLSSPLEDVHGGLPGGRASQVGVPRPPRPVLVWTHGLDPGGCGYGSRAVCGVLDAPDVLDVLPPCDAVSCCCPAFSTLKQEPARVYLAVRPASPT